VDLRCAALLALTERQVVDASECRSSDGVPSAVADNADIGLAAVIDDGGWPHARGEVSAETRSTEADQPCYRPATVAGRDGHVEVSYPADTIHRARQRMRSLCEVAT
jgi:hypothetical protein